MAVSRFGLPISAPQINTPILNVDQVNVDNASVTGSLMASEIFTNEITATNALVDALTTDLIGATEPEPDSGAPGSSLQIQASDGADSASTAGGKGGALELFAGDAGSGTSASNGGSVILRAGTGDGLGVSGVIRVDNGPLLISGGLVDLGAGGSDPGPALVLTVAQIRAGLLFGAPTGGAAAQYNVPNAALLVQGFPGIKEGDIIRFSVVNTGAQPIQMGGAALAVGQITVNTTQSAAFALIATNVTPSSEAFTLYRVST